MAVTAKNIKDCHAEFAGLSDDLVDKFRLQAERRINLAQWAGKADDAILWLTAHLLKINKIASAGGDAVAGPVTQKKVGDLSVSYASSGKLTNKLLETTIYGQYYMELKRGIWPSRVLA